MQACVTTPGLISFVVVGVFVVVILQDALCVSCGSVCRYVHMSGQCYGDQRALHGASAAGGCEPPEMGTRKQTQVLCKLRVVCALSLSLCHQQAVPSLVECT